MRITESQLRRIIREEARRITLNESVVNSAAFSPVESASASEDPEADLASKALGVPMTSLVASDDDLLEDMGKSVNFIPGPPSAVLGRRGLLGTIDGMPAVSINAGGLNVYFVARGAAPARRRR